MRVLLGGMCLEMGKQQRVDLVGRLIGREVADTRQDLEPVGPRHVIHRAFRRGAIRGPLGPIRVPTLYIWGDADDTVGRVAAEGTVDFIAAPYRFEVLPGVGHFAADQAPERVSELMLEHLAAHPV